MRIVNLVKLIENANYTIIAESANNNSIRNIGQLATNFNYLAANEISRYYTRPFSAREHPIFQSQLRTETATVRSLKLL